MSVKVYVVSLERAIDRRRLMEGQLRKIGLAYEFIPACDARKITEEEICAINLNKVYAHDLRKGEIACARSHATACKALAANREYHYGLIVEDDVILSDKLPSILAELEREQPEDEITLLYSSIQSPTTFRKESDLLLDYELVSPDSLYGVFGAAAYFMSARKAQKLVKQILPVRTIADDWDGYYKMNYISGLKLVYPFPVLHAELLSSVNENQTDEKPRFRTHLKNIIYYHRIFPFYQLFLWRRRKVAEKIQRRNINAPDFSRGKTYKL